MNHADVQVSSDHDFSVIKFRGEQVPWFGLIFSWLAMLLGVEVPEMRKQIIEFVPGDLLTPEAIASGGAHFGMTTPPVCAVMAYRGVGPYTRAMTNLRSVANYPHDDRLVWAVDAELGIESLEDLRGRKLRFALPARTSPVGFAVEKILEAQGMPIEQLEREGWQFFREGHLFKTVELGLRGEVDMLVHEGRKTPPWVQLTEKRPMKFLGIPENVRDMMEREYGFRKATLSRGMINGAVTEDLPTLDWSGWLLFTRDDVPDELISRVTRLVVERRALVEWAYTGQPLEKSDLVYPVEPTQLCEDFGLPLHPAAERYYRENGYLGA